MLARNKLLLAGLLSAVLVSAAAYAAVKVPVNADEPITMTKGMYADLLCVAVSEFEPYKGGIEFTYDPTSDTVKATCLPSTRIVAGARRSKEDMAYGKTVAQEKSEACMKLILPKLKRHVSPAATSVFEGF